MNKKELLSQIYDTLFQNKNHTQFDPNNVTLQSLFEDGCIWFELDDGTAWEISIRQLLEGDKNV
jgi:hypothetical protein